MKNKKLFAILTLVCFMFTLMPVAAFAADSYNYVEVTGNTSVTRGGSVDLLMDTDFTTESYYVFAYTGGVYSTQFGIQSLTFNAGNSYTQAVVMNVPAGEYELFVVDANSQTEIVMANAALLNSEKAAKMLADTTKVSMLDNDVTVTNPSVTYGVAIAPLGTYTLQADGGYTDVETTISITAGTKPVPNVDVNVYTDSYGLQVEKLDAKTNAKGEMDILITGTVPGTFNVYAEFGGTVASIPVTVSAVGLSDVKVTAEPTAPVARTVSGVQNATAANSGIEFLLTDKFGSKITPSTGNHKVTLISAPAGVDKDVDLTLVAGPTGHDYVIKEVVSGSTVDYNLTVNGEYTFKVALQNGASATASVTVADFAKTTAIKFVKTPVTVPYGVTSNVYGAAGKVVAVDAKGVTKDITATLSVNGKAVESFTSPSLLVKDNPDYVGSKITVIAVYTEGANTFTATHELTVVDDAALVNYTSKDAEVGVSSTLYAYVLDSNGKTVSLPYGSTTVQAIVLDKPANSVVTVSDEKLNTKGQVEFTMLASAAGEYTIQTIVTFGGKYVSSIDTFTVGAGEGTFDDIVVVSIGANKMIVNDKVVALDVAPFITNGRTMLQYNVLGNFGIDVNWVQETRSVVAEGNGIKVVMTLDSKVAVVNGEEVTLDVAPYAVNGRTIVPVGFITGTFGITPTFTYNADGTIADILFAK